MSWTGTRPLPLDNDHDVLARVGFRFLWATVPYIAIAWLAGLDPFGPPRPSPFSGSLLAVSVPLVGGLMDWYRVRHPRPRP